MEIPHWFVEGLQFKSKWINYGDNICSLISFSRENNMAEVKITAGESEWTEDNWNLEHTIWGFERGDYSIIERKVNPAFEKEPIIITNFYRPETFKVRLNTPVKHQSKYHK